MSRYIDAEILSDALRHLTLGETDAARATMKITHYVSRMPTVDAVEVVRCKDCKYSHKEWHQDKRNKDGGYWIVGCGNDAIAERVYGLAQDNDFCSYGERADE